MGEEDVNEVLDVGDDYDSDEPREVSQGTGSIAARLPEGSGYLVVEGQGAGTVVDSAASSELQEAALIRGRDEALDGEAPLLLVHRPYKHWRAVPRLLAEVHVRSGSNLTLGVVSKLGAFSDKSHVEFGDLCGVASIRIVDPDACYGQPSDLRLQPPSARRQGRTPYLAGAETSTEEIIEMQRLRGANLLLTPGYALNPASPNDSLDALCAGGDEALAALQPGERLALNIAMSSAWLTEQSLLEELLAQLIDQEQFDSWYLRVQWRNVRSQTQPVDEQLLRGYRRIAELAADEDRRLLLPQTGLTGWLMLAFGAVGFGTGLGGSEQAFREEAGGFGPTSRVERYFERQLLHVIERTSRAALTSDPLYRTCSCAYCPSLLRGDASWSEENAGLHNIVGTADLAAEVAPRVAGRAGTHGAIRRAVRRAATFAENKTLTGQSLPRHLRIWDRIL